MKLSVVILICDKDFNLLNKLVKQINENVKINHEIVIVDNREKFKHTPLNIEGVKIYSENENLFPFESRRKAVLNCCSGDYVWFVDVDDEVCELNKFDYSEDLIAFNYWACEQGKELSPCKNAYHCSYTAGNCNFFNYSWRSVLKNAVWNKFYKKEILEEIYKHLPDGLKICLMEDTLLNILYLAKVKTIRFDTNFFYKYNFNSGDSVKTEYKSIEPLERLFTGFDIAIGLLNTWLSETNQDATGISAVGFYKGTIPFALKKIPLCSPKIREQYIELLERFYDRATLRSGIEEVKEFSDADKLICYEALKNKPLVILGKGENEYTIKQIKNKGCEVWTVGTYPEDGASRYYEWHGVEVNEERNVIRDYPKCLKKYGFLPLNNSISNMMLIAYEEGYTHIELLGCQMNTKEEYIKQRPAVAMVVGYLMGKGIEINWIGSPINEHYGMTIKKENPKGE